MEELIGLHPSAYCIQISEVGVGLLTMKRTVLGMSKTMSLTRGQMDVVVRNSEGKSELTTYFQTEATVTCSGVFICSSKAVLELLKYRLSRGFNNSGDGS